MELLPWVGNNDYLTQLADSLDLFDGDENRFDPEELNEIPSIGRGRIILLFILVM